MTQPKGVSLYLGVSFYGEVFCLPFLFTLFFIILIILSLFAFIQYFIAATLKLDCTLESPGGAFENIDAWVPHLESLMELVWGVVRASGFLKVA